MPLYWLVYRHNNSIFVVIEPAHSLIHARLRASIDGLDEGEFTEGHELPGKWKVAMRIISAVSPSFRLVAVYWRGQPQSIAITPKASSRFSGLIGRPPRAL